MKNYFGTGHILTVTAAHNVVTGAFHKIGGLTGIALHDAKSGESLAIQTSGIFEVAKDTGGITAGAVLYLDPAKMSVISTKPANGITIGFALESKLSADTTVKMFYSAAADAT